MNKQWRTFYDSEKGEGFISFTFLIWISLLLMLLSVSIYQAYTLQGYLQTACTETLQLMKAENGADEKTKRKFDILLTKMGIPSRSVTYQATPKSAALQRGDYIEITATKNYRVFALKAFGVEYTVPITAKATGFAHKYVRGA